MILVTHQIQFIRKATKILVLNEGKQLAFDGYSAIINSGIDLVTLLKKSENEQPPPTTLAPTLPITLKKSLENKDSDASHHLIYKVRTDSVSSRLSLNVHSAHSEVIKQQKKN